MEAFDESDIYSTLSYDELLRDGMQQVARKAVKQWIAW